MNLRKVTTLASHEDLLKGMNEPQRAAVLQTEGPLLILAGPGSGKTRVITHKIAWLLESGVPPEAVIAITFTRKAAGEMKERLQRLVGEAAQRVWISTFHSACVRMLRAHGERIGLPTGFTMLDESEQESLIAQCIRDLGMSERDLLAASVLAAISLAKNAGKSPDDLAATARTAEETQTAAVFRIYQERLRQQNTVDYDDLLVECVRLFRTCPDVLALYQDRLRYILVDEYQDTSAIQNEWVFLLASAHRNLSVVGDEDQGIYSWRGADITNILMFQQQYPDARIIKLEQNYRCSGNILGAAAALVQHNRERMNKRIFTLADPGDRIRFSLAPDPEAEAAHVAREIATLLEHGLNGCPVTPGDIAVFYRIHPQSAPLSAALTRHGIAHRVHGGKRLLEHSEVRSILAYLRLIANPSDASAFERVVQAPRRGIHPDHARAVARFARDRRLPVGTLDLSRTPVPDLPDASRDAIARVLSLVAALRQQAEALPVDQLIEAVLDQSGLLAELQADQTEAGIERLERVGTLIRLAAAPSDPADAADGARPLDRFLSSLMTAQDLDPGAAADSAVSLMTLHAAKGLEFPVVFIVGMEEGILPHGRSLGDGQLLEEERRLCYVGMTRAEQRLYLSACASRTDRGRGAFNLPSRFLGEIPPALLEGSPTAASERPHLTAASRLAAANRTVQMAVGAPGAQGFASGALPATGAVPASSAPAWARRRAPQPGARVSHPRYGVGVVESVRKGALMVRFGDAGTVALLASQVQVLDEGA